MNDEFRLPVLMIEADNCAEAWIKTVKAVWEKGKLMPNHYEIDTPSKEATVMVNIKNPLKEPRIHIADFIGTQELLINKKRYVAEVLEGTLDDKVDEGILSYTYHRRLWNWGKSVNTHDSILEKKKLPILTHIKYRNGIGDYFNGPYTYTNGINQIQYLINKIKEESISRKLQVTTWIPTKDLIISGAPCLQRLWFRIIDNKYLICETHWRSRDLIKAWSSNVYAMVEIAKHIAEEVGMELTQMLDTSNSLHIYFSDEEKVDQIFRTMEKRGMSV